MSSADFQGSSKAELMYALRCRVCLREECGKRDLVRCVSFCTESYCPNLPDATLFRFDPRILYSWSCRRVAFRRVSLSWIHLE